MKNYKNNTTVFTRTITVVIMHVRNYLINYTLQRPQKSSKHHYGLLKQGGRVGKRKLNSKTYPACKWENQKLKCCVYPRSVKYSWQFKSLGEYLFIYFKTRAYCNQKDEAKGTQWGRERKQARSTKSTGWVWVQSIAINHFLCYKNE